jgi:hypothetical protein
MAISDQPPEIPYTPIFHKQLCHHLISYSITKHFQHLLSRCSPGFIPTDDYYFGIWDTQKRFSGTQYESWEGHYPMHIIPQGFPQWSLFSPIHLHSSCLVCLRHLGSMQPCNQLQPQRLNSDQHLIIGFYPQHLPGLAAQHTGINLHPLAGGRQGQGQG